MTTARTTTSPLVRPLIEAGNLDAFGTQTISISEEKEEVVNANNP
jgi:hypothetical protein